MFLRQIRAAAVGASVVLAFALGFGAGFTVTDFDGNIYHTVQIGTQIWMAENLRVTHYRNGCEIAEVENDSVWSVLRTGALCWYDNDSAAYKQIYGALYNFYAVNDDRGLCPEGWHVATEAEWLELESFLGGRSVAGGKLKDTTAGLWNGSNPGATDESGFCGVPAGGRGRVGGSGEGGNYATWWSSTAYDSLFAWHFGLSGGNASIRSNPGHNNSGFSVRCVRD